MATIKAFSDLEQSRKLADILPLESADMWYQHTGISIKDGSEKPIYFPMVIRDCETDLDVPCWSLSALLRVLPDYTLQTNTDGTVFVVCESKKPMVSDVYDNPVDACVAMIEKLNELNLL